MKLVVGLGNPGEKYASVRHNLGFDVVDEFRRKGDWGNWGYEGKFKSEIVKKDETVLARPQTYMNNSGLAVRQLVDYYKISVEDVIVIHDELDLPLGKIKVRLGGAAAGHHGVESIIEVLKNDKFIRVRLGIGNLKIHSPEKFVLEPFLSNEKSQVKHMTRQALKAIDELLEKGLEYTQNQFN